MGNDDLNGLEAGFAEVESRVKIMTAENRMLRVRVSELEQELDQARQTARNFEHIQGKHLHIREKLERVLQTLETVREKEDLQAPVSAEVIGKARESQGISQ